MSNGNTYYPFQIKINNFNILNKMEFVRTIKNKLHSLKSNNLLLDQSKSEIIY